MPAGGERPRVCNDLRQMVLDDLDSGFTPKDITQRLRVSNSFISQLRKTYHAFGTVDPVHEMSYGPAPKITTAAADGMLDLFNQDPQCSLLDHMEHLTLEYGIEVSITTVSRKLKITYKRFERINQAQDPLPTY